MYVSGWVTPSGLVSDLRSRPRSLLGYGGSFDKVVVLGHEVRVAGQGFTQFLICGATLR